MECDKNRTSAEKYFWQVQVRSAGHLDSWIKDYLEVMNIQHEKDGSTHLSGELPDFPAVYGLILQLRDAGIALLSLHVERVLDSNP